MLNDTLKLKGRVALVLRDKDGNIKEERDINNLVVTAGLDFIASRMKDATATVMSHMALGSSTTAAAAGQTDLTEAGIFNAASGGTMLCRTVFAVVNKQADDTMTVTWTVTIAAS